MENKIQKIINGDRLPYSKELIGLLIETEKIAYVSSITRECGDTDGYILWDHDIEIILKELQEFEEANAFNDKELGISDSRLMVLLQQALTDIQQEKAILILLNN